MASSHHSFREVTEEARERETFKYDSLLIGRTIRYSSEQPVPPENLTSSPDPALIAYAQLAALRLNVKRALISLFDRKFQYVLAEATPSLPLTPCLSASEMAQPELCLSGTALPRPVGVCSRVLVDPKIGRVLGDEGAHAHRPANLPVTIIPDMTQLPQTADSLYCQDPVGGRFYAAVPIRTRRGIDIGVVCVIDDKPRDDLDSVAVRLMQDLSAVIMSRFEASRSAAGYRRADRMVRGLGSFVEGKTTVSGWHQEANTQSYDSHPSGEGNLNQNQQQHNVDPDAAKTPSEMSGAPHDPVSQTQDSLSPTDAPTEHPKSIDDTQTEPNPSHPGDLEHVFAKVSNIIRESIEVEGVLFLDASIASFGGLASAKATTHNPTSSSSSSSSSDGDGDGSRSSRSDSQDETKKDTMCQVLGFSTSTSSSIDGKNGQQSHVSVPEKLLAKLLRRYPTGKIFNFDDNGSIQSSDLSGDEIVSPDVSMLLHGYVPPPSNHLPDRQVPQTRRDLKENLKRRFSRENEGKVLAAMFPGARSVVLVPVWDAQKERWFAGGFVYTQTPTRFFTVEGELSYLRAFGSVIMSEVARVKAHSDDKVKSDLLSSLSHELRSPLHGVVLGVELLQDTALDAFQGDVLHSVETCGRTLLDTMDHLLDWSKINSFKPSGRSRVIQDKPKGSRRRPARMGSIDTGMMSITSDVDVSVLTEEVVESLCAGFNFQKLSVAQLGALQQTESGDGNAVRRLDTMQAVENIITGQTKSGGVHITLGDVTIGLDMEAQASWLFRTQAGALRRIVMNILGNSLKYTNSGFIKVCLSQHASAHKPAHYIQLTVVDSGRGISTDYMQHRLFSPFSQEDSLAAGAGLGLSLVKRIVTSLGGSVQVQSQLQRGTTVTVKLPLHPVHRAPPPTDSEEGMDDFEAQISELQGLRVRLVGFEMQAGEREGKHPRETFFDQEQLMVNLCHDWLRLHVITNSQQSEYLPDFVLCDTSNLNRAFSVRGSNSSVPIIVVCSDPLVARRLATSPAFNRKTGVLEFISQPVGPRKLAKILLLSFRRWTNSRSSKCVSSTLSGASSDRFATGTPGTPNVATPDLSHSQGEAPEMALTPMADGEQPPAVPETQEMHDRLDDSGNGLNMELPVRTATPARSPGLNDGSGESLGTSTPRAADFLLVDDNPVNLKMISHHMKKLGQTFDTATDGQKAFDAVRAAGGRYKCIFMDISMPVMDGFESTRQIRSYEREQHIPACHIFALTGIASEAAQQEAFASGIELFLTKPVKLKELNRILEERKLTRKG